MFRAIGLAFSLLPLYYLVQELMDKLATLQNQLKEAENKKVALQDQVRNSDAAKAVRHTELCPQRRWLFYVAIVSNVDLRCFSNLSQSCFLLYAGDRLRQQTSSSGATNIGAWWRED